MFRTMLRLNKDNQHTLVRTMQQGLDRVRNESGQQPAQLFTNKL